MNKEQSVFHDETGERRFTLAYKDILFDKKLTGNDKVIYLYLKMYGGQNKLAFTGLERISEEMNMSINTIRKSLESLQKHGYLKITKEKQKHGYFLNNYHIYDPFNNVTIETKKELSSKEDSSTDTKDIHKEIISYLNDKANKSFKADSKGSQRLINGRLSAGYTIDQFKYVIDVKTKEWLNNSKMNQFLAPTTLFRPNNFGKYLNEEIDIKKENKPKNDNNWIDEMLGGI